MGIVRCLAITIIIAGFVSCSPGEHDPGTLGPHDFAFPANSLISHALGGIDGKNYSNSVEALEQSLARGSRFLEVDLSFTADGDLVCFHKKHEKHLGVSKLVTHMTTEEFLTYRYADRFTLMDLETLLRRLTGHPGVYLITDCKDNFNACMDTVLSVAEAVDPSLVGRIIPQFYTAEQWLDIAAMESEHGSFATVIFTLYRIKIDDDSVVALATDRGVPVITMSRKRFNPHLVARLSAVGVDSLIHTVNKPDEMMGYVEHGARGLYTDRFAAWSEVVDAAEANPHLRTGRSEDVVGGPPRG